MVTVTLATLVTRPLDQETRLQGIIAGCRQGTVLFFCFRSHSSACHCSSLYFFSFYITLSLYICYIILSLYILCLFLGPNTTHMASAGDSASGVPGGKTKKKKKKAKPALGGVRIVDEDVSGFAARTAQEKVSDDDEERE